jgi:inhibitor of cysteine peptidase
MRIINSFFLLVLGFSVWASDNPNETIVVNPKKPNFTITVNSNPTTGFRWSVKSMDEGLFSLVSSNYQRGRSKLIGTGGQTTFRFKLNEMKKYPKKTTIILFYSQPWQPKRGTIKKFTISIK